MPIFKGNAIIGQSGGCTAVINESLIGVVDAARSNPKIRNLWGSLHGVTGILNGNFIDLLRQPKTLTKQIQNLPSAALGSARRKLKPGEEENVARCLKKWDVRHLFFIGGNDTADSLFRIAKASERIGFDLKAIHIPKTIDNDLMETDHTPGYGSAARFAAITTQEAGLDTKAMRFTDPVKIIELMGRNSGWLVAASTLLKKTEADPPHLLYLPEVAFDEKKYLASVERVLKRVGYCLVVISETIRDKKGNRIGAKSIGITRDGFGHQYVEGAAAHLARLVESRLKVRARFDKPGTIQRMSVPYRSEVDAREAYEAGRKALTWATRGISNSMVGFKRLSTRSYKIEYVPVPLQKIPNQERYLPAKFLNRERNGMTRDFVRYALPLIGGNLPEFPDWRPARVSRAR